jgi:ribonuclease H2 subunit C
MLHLRAGVSKPLPAGYTGLVLRPDASSSSGSDAQQRSWHTAATFSEVCLWNHDAAPAAADWHARAVDWLALAAQVHAPISPAQVAAELQQMAAVGAAGAAGGGSSGTGTCAGTGAGAAAAAAAAVASTS